MKIIASNKRASFDYFLYTKYEAGIMLVGSEVKSVRSGHVSINESFVLIENGEVFLKNAYIKPYEKAMGFNLPDSRRSRKLLLSKGQILKLEKERQSGMTIVPTKIYISNGFVKLEIAVAKSKKKFDKRQVLAKESAEREILRHLKGS